MAAKTRRTRSRTPTRKWIWYDTPNPVLILTVAIDGLYAPHIPRRMAKLTLHFQQGEDGEATANGHANGTSKGQSAHQQQQAVEVMAH